MDVYRLRLRRKEEAVWQARVVEWFLPEPVSRQEQAAPPLVPQRECEHAFEAVKTIGSRLSVGMQDHLDVGPCREHVPTRTEVIAQGVGVVDLAISNQVQAPVSARERLPTCAPVHDAQAADNEPPP